MQVGDPVYITSGAPNRLIGCTGFIRSLDNGRATVYMPLDDVEVAIPIYRLKHVSNLQATPIDRLTSLIRSWRKRKETRQ